jgi:hypothetical protein
LHELPLEDQKRDQGRCGCHQSRGRDDCPVDALIAGGKHVQSDRGRDFRKPSIGTIASSLISENMSVESRTDVVGGVPLLSAASILTTVS